MKPIPETVEAIDNLDPAADGRDLLADLSRLACQAREIIPDLVGVSIAPFDDGITFTLVASSAEIAVLDAVQYLDGGPCVDAAHTDEVVDFHHDVLDEARWRLFAEATAARAVRSTLTLPVLSDARVVGTVNLYAASRQAFCGLHEQLAEVFGAWAAGAVANADLSFLTRDQAQAAPQRVQDQNIINVATGFVAAHLGVDVERAEVRMLESALRGGVTLLQLAREIVNGQNQGHDPA
jgi:GAF domain-containing protein